MSGPPFLQSLMLAPMARSYMFLLLKAAVAKNWITKFCAY
jgi:hypothetical protein